MLFNSYPYIPFLVLSVLAFVFLEKKFPGTRRGFLLLISYVFYAWWRADFLLLLIGSTAVNYVIGLELTARKERGSATRPLLILGLAFNLGLLGLFKYAGMLVGTTNFLFGTQLPIPAFFLPLAISFFTFEQISYLVDASSGMAKRYAPLDYALFVAYFPHLIAGPIIRHNELIPQFHAGRDSNARAADIAVGATLFSIGLAKKTLIADNLAPYSDLVFSAANHGAVSPSDAWLGTLFFVFQVYFDFSAYSDMALGTSAMFGIRLPVNFNSPYKALNIAEFWRRWHVTLQKFILDYLYTPLAVSLTRKSLALGLGRWSGFLLSGALPLLFVFMLIGLWHGAGWNFAVFGLMHGFYISVHEAWKLWRKKKKLPPSNSALSRIAAIALTFLVVVIADVVFRAASLGAVLNIYSAMVGLTSAATLISISPLAIAALATLFLLVWFAPNSMEITWKMRPALEPSATSIPIRDIGRLAWLPSRRSAIAFGLLSIAGLLALSNLSPFIYFQF
jgi:D-alanyl-lipoteichoic acid acyltransferase DltB (MBOAT superfamily)